MADCACEATSASGIGVGTGFVGLGFDGSAEDCCAAAVSPLKTQQNVMNKQIRITRRIRSRFERRFPADAAAQSSIFRRYLRHE